MAKVIGFVTKPSGESFPVDLQNLSVDDKLIDIAKGKTEEGKTDIMQAISRGKTLSFDGEVTGALSTLEAGQVISFDSEDYLINSAKKTWTAGKVHTFACTAEREDDAEITGFTAPTP